jgi:(S)-ureidoglycine aminohydrolase
MSRSEDHIHKLGHTRSAWHSNHLLLTPDSFVHAPLPGKDSATGVVHVSPAMGAAFTQYTAEMQPGGCLGRAGGQRFVYVLHGSLSVELPAKQHPLTRGGYAYCPSMLSHKVTATVVSRVAVIEKVYKPEEGANPPEALMNSEEEIVSQPLMGDPAVQVRTLLPEDPAFDFAVNTMTYQPGASLSRVEIHVMEHGLLMLEGNGIYRLGECWYPVSAGDFIWMGPYCPQWFGALGKVPAKYLIYKDWNRHPLS